MSRIVLVDQEDNAIGLKERSEITPDDIYRVSAVWIQNSKGEVLLARRALSKKNGPGAWGPAAAGTVDEGEEYLDNIIKEAEEEIGLSITADQLTPGPKFLVKGNNRHFVQWYYATVDKPITDFVLQEEEVMDIKWVQMEELLQLTKLHPASFPSTMPQWLPEVLKGVPAPIDRETGSV